jgi:hypothetical protein
MMSTNDDTSDEKSDESIYGKLIGGMKTRRELDAFCKQLSEHGVREIEVWDGSSGTDQLENWHETVSQFLMGDMEAEMVQRYLNAVSEGKIVFAAIVAPGDANAVGELARDSGAFHVAYFGNSVVTNY